MHERNAAWGKHTATNHSIKLESSQPANKSVSQPINQSA